MPRPPVPRLKEGDNVPRPVPLLEEGDMTGAISSANMVLHHDAAAVASPVSAAAAGVQDAPSQMCSQRCHKQQETNSYYSGPTAVLPQAAASVDFRQHSLQFLPVVFTKNIWIEAI